MRRRRHFVSSFVESKAAASKTLYDDQQYVKFGFDNGLTVIAQNMPHLRSISIGAWVLVGSRFETRSNMGISHFIEHAVFKGTRRRNALKIAKVLENVGGSLNAFTSKEQTCYYANILSEDLPLAIDVLADLVANARFDPKEIEKERQVVKEEIRDNNDSPEDFVQDQFYAEIFPNHPIGYNILGTDGTLSHMTIRSMSEYYRKHYTPSNMIISVAGNFRQSELESLVARRFRWPSSGIRKSYWPKGFQLYRKKSFRGTRTHVKKKLSQAHVCLGWPIPIPYTGKRKFDALALNTIIGGGMSSRLFQRIRERNGLAYSVYSFVDFMYDTGLFGIYVATDKAKVDRTIDKVKEEMRRLVAHPIGNGELKMAKAQIKAGLLFGLESTSTRMIRLAKNEIYHGRKVNVGDLTAAIDRISIEDLNDLAEGWVQQLDNMQVTEVS